METTIAPTVNEVKKELYRSKVNAKFSHYTSGNLYYTVELVNSIVQPLAVGYSTYMFSIPAIEKNALVAIETLVRSKIIELEKIDEPLDAVKNEIEMFKTELGKMLTLSSDLGTTTFSAEVKGSELNRWISKAIEKNDFVKVS